MNRRIFYDDVQWNKFIDFSRNLETPCLIVDLNIVKNNYNELKNHFPYAKIYFAVKSNPAEKVITLLRDLGSNFDIASTYELDKVLSLGVEPERLSFGNTIKKAKDIKYFYDKGVRIFATDSKADLQNIAKNAPGSKVFVRILVEGSQSADWPLSKKFG
ncbi:MAG TPA: type III PLP-dependent enzyme, partial [Spirochaetota bacterium]|nr:type III PLP-dependent enzyme [Spirochaetota bacterium]